MEVETEEPAEQLEVPCVMRHDHGPRLPGTQRDQQVVPEGRDLGPEVRFPPPDLADRFSGPLPGTCVGGQAEVSAYSSKSVPINSLTDTISVAR